MPRTRKQSLLERAIARADLMYNASKGRQYRPVQWKQLGGGKNAEMIPFKGRSYVMRESIDGSTILLHIGRRPPKIECILIFLEPNRSASLQNLKRFPDCAEEGNAPGEELVELAVDICLKRGVHTLVLTDNSTKGTPSGSRFRISDASFLSTGQTWYERWIPYQYTTDFDHLAEWKATVAQRSWNEVEQCLRQKVPDLKISVDTSGLDLDQPGTGMTVLRRSIQARGDFFERYGHYLPQCFTISTMYGIQWTFDLTSPRA